MDGSRSKGLSNQTNCNLSIVWPKLSIIMGQDCVSIGYFCSFMGHVNVVTKCLQRIADSIINILSNDMLIHFSRETYKGNYLSLLYCNKVGVKPATAELLTIITFNSWGKLKLTSVATPIDFLDLDLDLTRISEYLVGMTSFSRKDQICMHGNVG